MCGLVQMKNKQRVFNTAAVCRLGLVNVKACDSETNLASMHPLRVYLPRAKASGRGTLRSQHEHKPPVDLYILMTHDALNA